MTTTVTRMADTGRLNYDSRGTSANVKSIDRTKTNEMIQKTSAGVEEIMVLTKSERTDVALEVLNGKYGSGEERKQKLAAAGYDSTEVQEMVNKMLDIKSNESTSATTNSNISETQQNIEDIKKANVKEQEEMLRDDKAAGKSTMDSVDSFKEVFDKVGGALGTATSFFGANSAANQEKVNELSANIIKTGTDEYSSHANSGSYRNGNWCANFATWIWKNSSVDGKSAYEIAKLNSSFTSSTGKLMMHFLTADHPDLGIDYTHSDFYDSEINNNIAFYYNDRLSGFEGKNSGKLPEGEKNYIPKPGDLVFFDIDGRGDEWVPILDPNQSNATQDHTGMVKNLIKNDAGEVIGITTIEGNITINGVNGYYSRDIYFNDTSDKYSVGLIGYGTVTSIPS